MNSLDSLDSLDSSGSLSLIKLTDLPKRGEVGCWAGLYGAAKWIVIAEAVRRLGKLFVLLVPDVRSVETVTQDFSFFAPDLKIHRLPDWETLAYDRFSPYQDIVSERLHTLSEMPQLKTGIVIASIQTAMHRLLPKAWLIQTTFSMKRGEKIDRETFRRRLTESGYIASSQVSGPGEFAVRGSLIDVFPAGSKVPFRIDLFDEEIDTLRVFDPETQRTIGEVEDINILPGREFPSDQLGISEFRRSWRQAFARDYLSSPIYQDVSEGLAPAGIEYYLPFFHTEMNLLTDYIPAGSVIVLDEGIEVAAEGFDKSLEERYEALSHDVDRPILPRKDLFV